MLEFTADEEVLITRLSIPGGWDDKDAAPLKKKIKDYYLNQGAAVCCYCRRAMHQWHRMTIDVEHVLPKSKYPEFTFHLRNLNLSCKRCNMQVKGEDLSFFTGPAGMEEQFDSGHYNFIHPNLDRCDEHLAIMAVQLRGKLLVKYWIAPDSLKGEAAYTYFELQKLEVNSFDDAQGLGAVVPDTRLPEAVARELRAILGTLQ